MKMKSKGELNGFLDAGSHLDGELRFDDTFRVDGKLTGGVTSDGVLYIGERGVVDGEVRVARVFVSGTLSGRIFVAERLEIAPGGRLLGEVTTPCLILDEGAIFDGVSKMLESSSSDNVAPMRRERSS